MNASIIILLCLATFFATVLYAKAKSLAMKIFSSCLMAGILALCAYYFVPNHNFDLTRHHEMAMQYSAIDSIEQFARVSQKSDLEIIPQAYSLLIGKIGDINLMQALLVFAGYGLLFYMLVDYKNKKNIRNKHFLPLVLFVAFGQHTLYYFSGLYNYFAINLFAFTVYLDYILGHKKIACVLYILSPFIHVTMLLPLCLMIMFKCMRGKISRKFYIVFALALIGFGATISFVANVTNIDFMVTASRTYIGYVEHNDYMIGFYDGFYLIMTIVKICSAFLAYRMTNNNKETCELGKYANMLSVATIMLSFSSLAMTRFSSLVLFVSSPILLDAVSANGNNKAKVLRVIILVFAIAFAVYSAHTVIPFIRIGAR